MCRIMSCIELPLRLSIIPGPSLGIMFCVSFIIAVHWYIIF